ncbi:hypothetical protein MC885_015296 [Smutsia gigantea]|nr:hypothetical protein MC885_015296 [Smutsia gigantea]
MKHYEVRNEETDADRPPQTYSFFFAGPRDPASSLFVPCPFPSRPIPRREIQTAQAQWVLVVHRLHSYIAVRMCEGGPGNLAGFLQLPMQAQLQNCEGRARVRGDSNDPRSNRKNSYCIL